MKAPFNMPPGVSVNDIPGNSRDVYMGWPIFCAEHPDGVDEVLAECVDVANTLFESLEAIRKGDDDLMLLITAKMALTRWQSTRDEAARKWTSEKNV